MVDVCMVGLGPVGLVSGACFAKQGFKVVGVDVNPKRVNAVKEGRAGFIGPGIDELISKVHGSGHLDANDNLKEAAQQSRIIMIAVGTPTPQGAPDLSFLEAVAKTVGEAFKEKHEKDVCVVVRSTVPPGTMRNRLSPIIEKYSGLKAGKDFHIASNPEFLREGKAIDDFFETGRVVIGADSPVAASMIEALYKDVKGQVIHVAIETAEFAKYVDNSWHAVKVAFANEIGRVVEGFGGNVDDTTKIFISDDKLNISPYYMRPGFAFGGSCLPKDVRGLCYMAEQLDVELPLMNAVLPSNDVQIQQGVAAILSLKPRMVGMLGIAFKPHVDDLRESPYLHLVSDLLKAGIKVAVFDSSFTHGESIQLPDSKKTITVLSGEEVLAQSDVLALSHYTHEYSDLLKRWKGPKERMVDLTRPLPAIARLASAA